MRLVTCELPADDDLLFNIVTSVQKPSEQHSKACKKRNTVCRFNFPGPVSARTFICRKPVKDICTRPAGTMDVECARHGRDSTSQMPTGKVCDIYAAIKTALSQEKACGTVVWQFKYQPGHF